MIKIITDRPEDVIFVYDIGFCFGGNSIRIRHYKDDDTGYEFSIEPRVALEMGQTLIALANNKLCQEEKNET